MMREGNRRPEGDKAMAAPRIALAFTMTAVSVPALAEPVGIDLDLSVQLTAYDLVSGDLSNVRNRTLYSAAMHTLAGDPTLMSARPPSGVSDMLVTSVVETIGMTRTIAIRFETVTGEAMIEQSYVDSLGPADGYDLSFEHFGPIVDPDRVGSVRSDRSLLGLDGETFGGGFTTDNFFYSQAIDTLGDIDSPAGPDFFGLTPIGIEYRYTYQVVPTPGTAFGLALVGLAAARHRR